MADNMVTDNIADGQAYCSKCRRIMDSKNFYKYKDGTYMEQCKKCITMHIDNYNPETYLWIIEKLDIPYVPSEWDVLRDRAYAKNPLKMTGMSVIGKYISKMKLNQWNKFSWADSEELQKKDDLKRALKGQEVRERDAMMEDIKGKYERGEICEAEYKTYITPELQQQEIINMSEAAAASLSSQDTYLSEEQVLGDSLDLTSDDQIYLAMKWGRFYRPSQWIELEKKYIEMTKSFDIQDSDTEGTLILICKTYLKMNEALDSGDVDGFNKLSRTYDTLRKSAKFTAAQNKEEKGEYVDSVGELVAICEKDGFIPRLVVDVPQDKLDATLKDMNNYVYNLVTKDLGFGQQIEDALKKIQIQKEMEEDEAKLGDDNDYLILEDEDIIEYKEAMELQIEMDNEEVY